MADVQLVETSLRDGNQCLWAALGIDTARTLTIAPVMDRVGFKAIDFTTSTHMGVAVRYKKEDPWERIRLMAAAMPNTPLQFMSTGFRFISWETAHPEFMALAFRVLARNGIRRFCLADPMNDADSNIACARMVKQGGGEYVIAALVFTLSPVHDDAHYVGGRAQARGVRGHRRTLHQGPGRAALAQSGANADSGDQGRDRHQAAGAARPLHHRARRARLHGCAGLRRELFCSAPPARRPMALRIRLAERVVANLRALGHTVRVDDEALKGGRQLLHAPCRGRGVADGAARRPLMRPICSINCRAAWSAPCAVISPRVACRTWKGL